MMRRQAVFAVFLSVYALTANACRSNDSPTAPSAPPSVSRWIEYTADDQVIEDVGISPDVFVPSGPGDFMQGRDPVLDWALNAGGAADQAPAGPAYDCDWSLPSTPISVRQTGNNLSYARHPEADQTFDS